MDVFKVEFLVEDKKLAQVQRLLTGQVYQLVTTPVVNAAVQKNGTVKAVGDGSAISTILKGLKAGDLLTAKEATARMKAAGFSRSRGYVTLSELTKSGVLKRMKLGQYVLNAPTKRK